MKKFSFLGLALSLMIATSALCQDVRYNYDKGTDFSKFKTYKWVLIKDAQRPNDIVDKQIKSTIDSQLLIKGLTAVDTDNADLFIGYQTAVGSEKQFSSFSSGMGPGWGYGGGWYGGGWYGGGGMSTTTGQPQPSTSASSTSICTTPPAKISSGEAPSAKPSTPRPNPTSSRRISIKPSPNSSKTTRHLLAK